VKNPLPIDNALRFRSEVERGLADMMRSKNMAAPIRPQESTGLPWIVTRAAFAGVDEIERELVPVAECEVMLAASTSTAFPKIWSRPAQEFNGGPCYESRYTEP
jgi:hypothetical protein